MATHFLKKKVELFHKRTLFGHTTQIYQNPMENESMYIDQEYTKILQWFVKIDVDINSVTNIFKLLVCFIRNLNKKSYDCHNHLFF